VENPFTIWTLSHDPGVRIWFTEKNALNLFNWWTQIWFILNPISFRMTERIAQWCTPDFNLFSKSNRGQVCWHKRVCVSLCVEAPYPPDYFSIWIRYRNNHMVISLPYPNAKVVWRIRRLHKNTFRGTRWYYGHAFGPGHLYKVRKYLGTRKVTGSSPCNRRC